MTADKAADLLDFIAKEFVDCNCGDGCDGTCTHSDCKRAAKALRNPPEMSVFVVDYHEGVCEEKITARYYFPEQASDSAAIVNMFAVNMADNERSGDLADDDVEPNEKGTISARFDTGMEHNESQHYWVVFGPDREDAKAVADKIYEEQF